MAGRLCIFFAVISTTAVLTTPLHAVPLPNHSQLLSLNSLYLTDSKELSRQTYLGEEIRYAASSCKEIAERKPNATSGYYWVEGLSTPHIMFCNLQREFVADTRGWMRVANFDMSNPAQACPRGLEYYYANRRRLCRQTRVDGGGCVSLRFSSNGIMWRQVCGHVISHHERTSDGILHNRFTCTAPCGIDELYVDGVSITHDHNPRKHIWTVTNGLFNQAYAPHFIGNNYATGGTSQFCTELLEPTTFSNSDIEVRVCRDQAREDEDVVIEMVKLYVR